MNNPYVLWVFFTDGQTCHLRSYEVTPDNWQESLRKQGLLAVQEIIDRFDAEGIVEDLERWLERREEQW